MDIFDILGYTKIENLNLIFRINKFLLIFQYPVMNYFFKKFKLNYSNFYGLIFFLVLNYIIIKCVNMIFKIKKLISSILF